MRSASYDWRREVRRRFYKNWYRAKKKAFTKYSKNFYSEEKQMSEKIQAEIKRAKEYCQVSTQRFSAGWIFRPTFAQ